VKQTYEQKGGSDKNKENIFYIKASHLGSLPVQWKWALSGTVCSLQTPLLTKGEFRSRWEFPV